MQNARHIISLPFLRRNGSEALECGLEGLEVDFARGDGCDEGLGFGGCVGWGLEEVGSGGEEVGGGR